MRLQEALDWWDTIDWHRDQGKAEIVEAAARAVATAPEIQWCLTHGSEAVAVNGGCCIAVNHGNWSDCSLVSRLLVEKPE